MAKASLKVPRPGPVTGSGTSETLTAPAARKRSNPPCRSASGAIKLNG